uniref:Uncharacterized protein n=1 Tax=Aegilops tauschii TaxID=37682 RepID=R7W6W8_AEGTA
MAWISCPSLRALFPRSVGTTLLLRVLSFSSPAVGDEASELTEQRGRRARARAGKPTVFNVVRAGCVVRQLSGKPLMQVVVHGAAIIRPRVIKAPITFSCILSEEERWITLVMLAMLDATGDLLAEDELYVTCHFKKSARAYDVLNDPGKLGGGGVQDLLDIFRSFCV